MSSLEERIERIEKRLFNYDKCEICCRGCDLQYYVGRKYHFQLMKIFWTISKYLLTKLSIPDIHSLEDKIVKLEQIYENEK